MININEKAPKLNGNVRIQIHTWYFYLRLRMNNIHVIRNFGIIYFNLSMIHCVAVQKKSSTQLVCNVVHELKIDIRYLRYHWQLLIWFLDIFVMDLFWVLSAISVYAV